ncbi:hypothetical protein [Proteus cibi]|uniref:hypothetical protein n=1 Tax=Proteus cibi TaxID=2050966 RepID=UPI0035A5EA57
MRKKVEKIKLGLDSYLKNGYLDINSFENPDDEAANALNELSVLDGELCDKYCKVIIESSRIGDDFLKARCLSLLFDVNKEYALDYIKKNVEWMSPSILSTTMIGLSINSKEKLKTEGINELISKIIIRYNDLSNDSFCKELLAPSHKFFQDSFFQKLN